MKPRVFSGIQPSGNLHIGNYLGSIRQWVKHQHETDNIFCIVDMHAITVPQDPKTLRQKSLETTAIYLASGIDPKESIIFIQSHNPDHANGGWILSCIASMGQLNRMTQYKDKSKGKDFVSVGLFAYPPLMAADILLYDTDQVPVGEDQKQHVELTRDLAERFNSRFGKTFKLPEPVLPKFGARIKSLVDPSKKMSKSDDNPNATIWLLDKPEDARKKIMSATTDNDRQVRFDRKHKPGVSNLLEIYAELKNQSVEESEQEFAHVTSYKDFKEAVAETVVTFLTDLQAKYHACYNEDTLQQILHDGATRSRQISSQKLSEIYTKVGFVMPR
jgi:tryptophanyl-tRNA synthetase